MSSGRPVFTFNKFLSEHLKMTAFNMLKDNLDSNIFCRIFLQNLRYLNSFMTKVHPEFNYLVKIVSPYEQV